MLGRCLRYFTVGTLLLRHCWITTGFLRAYIYIKAKYELYICFEAVKAFLAFLIFKC